MVSLYALAACSGTEEPADSSGTGGATTGATTGGAATGGAATGGAATGGGSSTGGTAALWSRDGLTCGTLGAACGDCSGETVCYFDDLKACIPDHGSSFICGLGSCDEASPYCIQGQCMTLDEASCFCTGEPGDSGTGCKTAPADHLAASACVEEGTVCGEGLSQCCDGTTCGAFAGAASTCIKVCTNSAECSTNCCWPVPGMAQQICAPSVNCQ